jgi:hypothetical protein
MSLEESREVLEPHPTVRPGRNTKERGVYTWSQGYFWEALATGSGTQSTSRISASKMM